MKRWSKPKETNWSHTTLFWNLLWGRALLYWQHPVDFKPTWPFGVDFKNEINTAITLFCCAFTPGLLGGQQVSSEISKSRSHGRWPPSRWCIRRLWGVERNRPRVLHPSGLTTHSLPLPAPGEGTGQLAATRGRGWGSAASRWAPVQPERASGRGGAGRGSQTAAPANLASITLPDPGLQGAGGAQLGHESGGTDGLSGSASSEGAAAVVLSEEKQQPQLALLSPATPAGVRKAGKGTRAAGPHPRRPRSRAPARGAAGRAP